MTIKIINKPIGKATGIKSFKIPVDIKKEKYKGAKYK